MSYRFEIDPAHNVLLVTFTGQLGDELAKKNGAERTLVRLSRRLKEADVYDPYSPNLF